MIDALLENNAAFARGFEAGDLPAPPAKKLAIVTCMDARMDLHRIVGLQTGDAHVIRNAGGVVTEDVLRSLAVSQHALGTEQVMLIHHTQCGMLGLDEDGLKGRIADATGAAPEFPFRGFSDLEESLRNSATAITDSSFLRFETIRAFTYDVKTGLLEECAL